MGTDVFLMNALKLVLSLLLLHLISCLDASRQDLLDYAAGVYTAESYFDSSPTLQNTILLTVHDPALELDLYINNLICICKNFHYKLLVYTLSDEAVPKSLFNSTHVRFISFPTAVLNPFRSHIRPRNLNPDELFNVDYNTTSTNMTSFSFGPLVKYIPMVEVLQAGYHALYLDPNIALFHDIIPYLFPLPTPTSSLYPMLNMIAIPDVLDCIFPSFHSLIPKSSIRINSGLLFLRKSPVTLDFVNALILKFVQQYAMYDGKVFSQVVAEKKAEWTNDCNNANHLPSESSSLSKNANVFRYCLLNEFLFQNGVMASHCSHGYDSSDSSIYDLYLLGMQKFGIQMYSIHTGKPISSPFAIIFSHTLYSTAVYSQTAPWLYYLVNNTKSCRVYDFHSTFYGSRKKLDIELRGVNNRVKHMRSFFAEGKMYVFAHQPHIYFKYSNWELVQMKSIKRDEKPTILRSFLHFLIGLQLKYPFIYKSLNCSVYETKHPLIYRDRYITDFSNIQGYIQTEDLSLVQPSFLLQYKRLHWQENLIRDNNSTRNETAIKEVLAAAAGIYVHEEPSYLRLYPELSKTVLMTFYEPSESSREEEYLFNLICFAQHYQLKLVVYVLDRKFTSFKTEKLRLESLSPLVTVLTFPYHILWKFSLKKGTPFVYDSQSYLFRSFALKDMPSLKDLCDAMKLIVIYEALVLGFGVIFLDSDVALLKDPIPFLMRGAADISFSAAIKGCSYPHLIESTSGYKFWSSLEPNLGIVRLRPTESAILLVSTWLEVMLEMNVHSPKCSRGRKLFFQVSVTLKASRRSDCNIAMTKPISFVRETLFLVRPTFCYLSEFQFANGYMENVCGMNKLGINKWANRTQLLEAYRVHGASTAYYSPEKSMTALVYHPAAVHVNYPLPSHKGNEMEKKGLQVYQKALHSCEPFDFTRTTYYTKKF